MIGITKQQQRAYDFIKSRISETGESPTYAEIATHCGLTAKSGAHRLVQALLKHGLVRPHEHGTRSLVVVSRFGAEYHLREIIKIMDGNPLSEHPAVRDALKFLEED